MCSTFLPSSATKTGEEYAGQLVVDSLPANWTIWPVLRGLCSYGKHPPKCMGDFVSRYGMGQSGLGHELIAQASTVGKCDWREGSLSSFCRSLSMCCPQSVCMGSPGYPQTLSGSSSREIVRSAFFLKDFSVLNSFAVTVIFSSPWRRPGDELA
jgi:hypothetical protein